ncbi:MAG: cell wall-binding repeat-containing protein [Acidimicrobiales bacterium]
MRRALLAPLVVAILLGSSGAAGAATTAVSIVDDQFQPNQISVAVGDTVTWTDNGSNSHSVTSDSGSFDSNPNCGGGGACLSKGQTFSFTFTQPGTYAYHCRIHGAAGGVGMSGVVVVGQAGSSKPVKRLAGDDRVLTAVAVSRDAFGPDGSAKAVVLARAAGFADALAGTPLAVAKGGPLLLVADADVLPPAVQSEIQRVLPRGAKVYLLGGESAIRPGIAVQLGQLGYMPVRYAGTDRYATALTIASQGLGDPMTIVLATGTDFPDALAGGAGAAKAGAAVLLSNGSTMTQDTSAYLAAHSSDKVFALGGPAATADRSATPLVGSDRWETSVKVAQQFFSGPATAGVSSGSTFADALAGGSHAARAGGPLLLTAPSALPAAVAGYLNSARSTIGSAFVYGGAAAVGDNVVVQVQGAIS